VTPSSIPPYITAVRKHAEHSGMLPLPPTPGEHPLLATILRAATNADFALRAPES
jgi:hypothetical protein